MGSAISTAAEKNMVLATLVLVAFLVTFMLLGVIWTFSKRMNRTHEAVAELTNRQLTMSGPGVQYSTGSSVDSARVIRLA
jgi:glycerol uptake facilitator-like aquaporin